MTDRSAPTVSRSTGMASRTPITKVLPRTLSLFFLSFTNFRHFSFFRPNIRLLSQPFLQFFRDPIPLPHFFLASPTNFQILTNLHFLFNFNAISPAEFYSELKEDFHRIRYPFRGWEADFSLRINKLLSRNIPISHHFMYARIGVARVLTRWEIYEILESALGDSRSGKACLLRAICEASATPFHGVHGLASQLVRLLLT